MKSQTIKNHESGISSPKSKPRVFVGLSGGVDSAVSAALLKRQGFDVTGVFIKAWDPEGDTLAPRSFSGVGCGWRENRRSAMRVAAILDIPFITLDLEKEYKKDVVDYMIEEYKKGNTPNPDVMCNKAIKFGHFLKFALDNEADFVATGHYAQKAASSKQPVARRGGKKNLDSSMLDTSYWLLEGADKNKDQSYFLWTLTQRELRHTLFPVGHLKKEEVRKLAKKFGLPQAVRKDSQGLCFLGKIDMKEFLKKYVSSKKGSVLDEKGNVIGRHEGAVLYTTGERHGFTITKKTESDSALYVVGKNVEKNTITVASKQQLASMEERKETEKPFPLTPSPKDRGIGGGPVIFIKNINWISGKTPDLDKKYSCRLRYRQEKISCKIKSEKEIELDSPELASSGQSLVIYDGETCLGGGVIS
jgi:tRNA-specific 2-thiouridylase